MTKATISTETILTRAEVDSLRLSGIFQPSELLTKLEMKNGGVVYGYVNPSDIDSTVDTESIITNIRIRITWEPHARESLKLGYTREWFIADMNKRLILLNLGIGQCIWFEGRLAFEVVTKHGEVVGAEVLEL
jgi:hypothetical protein